MKRAMWFLLGYVFLCVNSGAQEPPVLQGRGDKQIKKALRIALLQAGLGSAAVDTNPGGTPCQIDSFDITGFKPLMDQLSNIRRNLKRTFDDTLTGAGQPPVDVRVVLGNPGGRVKNDVIGTNTPGAPGASISRLGLGDDNKIIAIGGDGGDGADGREKNRKPDFSINGGDGGEGGAVTITCNDRNTIVAIGGNGGKGGNAGVSGLIVPFIQPGNNGAGGRGGDVDVTFNTCNSISEIAGTGGEAGVANNNGPSPSPRAPGRGGDVSATATSNKNTGFVQAGAGGPPNTPPNNGTVLASDGLAIVPPGT